MVRRFVLLCCLHYVSLGLAAGQVLPGQVNRERTPVLSPHFEPELAYDPPTAPERWTEQTAGLHAAFGSTDEIYFRSEVPAVGGASTAWEGIGWRGERLNAIILVWSRDPLDQVRLESGDLADGRGRVLSRESVRLQMVRYVLSNYPASASNATCDAGGTEAWLLPDRLEALDRFDVPGRT